MPHSSGGGSHGGGSHGGGSHSSSRGGSGSGGNSANRASSRPFSGATRYVYYHKKRPVSVYSNYDIRTNQNVAYNLFLILFCAVFIAVIGALGLKNAAHFPQKLDTSTYDSGYTISDKIGVIKDEAALKASLKAFYDETGISPMVVTVYNSDWNITYDNLEDFSYDLYLELFDDEKHWLIVYSQPKEPDPDFNDWYWEAMQGNDTDPILTFKEATVFENAIHKGLVRSADKDPGAAIAAAFDKTTKIAMRKYINLVSMVPSFLGIFIVLLLGYGLIDFHPFRGKYFKKAVICPSNLDKEETCDYCGGVYIVGFTTQCPHCGANIKPHDFTVDKEGNKTNILN